MTATTAPTGRRLTALLTSVLMIASVLVALAPASPAQAVPPATGIVIDDFEDGDSSDWGFFGGVAAGGGGGVASDRPYEGGFYLSTGWGGEGTASGFYGGAFKNFPDAGQVTPPAVDPWFNVWVYNQSNATVDGYTLEITIREDLDGNGWTNGSEDSFRLDTAFTSADFDDDWTLISAPLGAFTDLGTGGDGTFDGDLDEVVIVIAGVTGANPSTVEVDFDLFAFSAGGPLAFDQVVFDDMEHGDPFGNGWFSFGGSVGGGGIGPNTADLPPSDGGAFSLETGWGSGGTPGFFGGFGRTEPTDISGTDHFNFWINPDAGQDYTLEINLQEDDNGDGAISGPDDDEFQFNCVVSAAGPCATAGGGWQLVSIPLDDFSDDNSFLTGGNGVLDPTTPARGGNGELINVVIAIVSNTGADVVFRTDHWTFTRGSAAVAGPPAVQVIDDFESGVAPGTPCATGVPPLDFCTFNGAGSSVAISTEATPPAPVLPAVGTPNSVLRMDVDVTSFAGFIHGFESGGEWVSQDWSTREGLSLWFHGNDSGTTVFIDVLENRNPGSTTDDAERHTVSFTDDFTGWQLLEFPFSSFVRKEIGNGAPSDGFDRFEVFGWALGTLDTGGPRTFYVDEVSVYGEAELPPVTVNLAQANTPVEEGTTGQVAVKLNRPLGAEDPAQVSIDFQTEPSIATPGEEYTPTSGTLTFVNGGPSELTFPIETFDDTKFEGDERVVVRLLNPVDVERGSLFQGSVLITDNDPFDPNLLDDFERGAFLWDSTAPAEIEAVSSEASDPDARPGQDPIENVLVADVPLAVDVLPQGNVCKAGNGVVTVPLLSTPDFDATTVDPSTVTFGGATEVHRDKKTGKAKRHVEDFDGDGLDDLVFHFRGQDIGAACGEPVPFNGATTDGQAITAGGSDAAFSRDFAIGQDWSDTESLSFWYHGAGGGEDVTVTLKDNDAPDPGPAGWELVWSDEFDGAPGAPPNPENWTHEIGDVTPDGKNGWGNEELQYYTDDPANASTDGDGNLVITLREADGSQECYYGPCEYTSARLLSWHKAEFAYGRVESRLKVPNVGTDLDGLWPAFWSLGTDIDRNPWPGAGEIDMMEWVGRLPNEIFGTIHGPGYSGGGSFGGIYDFGEPVGNEYHTFTVEWEPNLITWYVDGIQYHQATPADVPGPWVFDKPFFLLLNFAIGGNFGGPVGDDVQFPQEYLVDYVRVFQGPDTAERFEASFTDDVAGWQQVTIPITDFVRSDDQPAGAPDDGLTLTDVNGYGFAFPNGNASGEARFDLVERVPVPPPTELVVTTLDDTGEGSLRAALATVADGGTITFDPSLAGGTIPVGSELVADRSVTIDASATPGIVLDGGGEDRVLRVTANATVFANDIVVTGGVGLLKGGGIQNFGTLHLERVVVRDNTIPDTAATFFEHGGAGIYNGADSVLTLVDSDVTGNVSVNQPGGGVYSFFGSDVTILRSTISGNRSGDVAGGVRSLGKLTVRDSAILDNTSRVFHGAGLWVSDSVEILVDGSTISGNAVDDGSAGGLMVFAFAGTTRATITGSTIAGNAGAQCQAQGGDGGGTATIVSGGGNSFGDTSCGPEGP